MRRYIASFVTAVFVILCVLVTWGIGQGQERVQVIDCRVLSEQEAKEAKLFEVWAVTVQCPDKTLWIPRKEYRIAQACSAVKMVRDEDGLHWMPEQEGECLVKPTAVAETEELAAEQQCKAIEKYVRSLDIKPNTAATAWCWRPNFNWR